MFLKQTRTVSAAALRRKKRMQTACTNCASETAEGTLTELTARRVDTLIQAANWSTELQ